MLGMEASTPSMLGKHTVLHSPALQTQINGSIHDTRVKLHICCYIGCSQTVCVTNRSTPNDHAAAQIPTEIILGNIFSPSQCLISWQCK